MFILQNISTEIVLAHIAIIVCEPPLLEIPMGLNRWDNLNYYHRFQQKRFYGYIQQGYQAVLPKLAQLGPVKFIYSEKVTKIWEIFTLLLIVFNIL